MWLIQIDKDRYINAINIDAVIKGAQISVAVSQNWFDVHPDYTEKFLNHLQACNGNHGTNIYEGLTDR